MYINACIFVTICFHLFSAFDVVRPVRSILMPILSIQIVFMVYASSCTAFVLFIFSCLLIALLCSIYTQIVWYRKCAHSVIWFGSVIQLIIQPKCLCSFLTWYVFLVLIARAPERDRDNLNENKKQVWSRHMEFNTDNCHQFSFFVYNEFTVVVIAIARQMVSLVFYFYTFYLFWQFKFFPHHSLQWLSGWIELNAIKLSTPS